MFAKSHPNFTAAMSSCSFLADDQYYWGDAFLDDVAIFLECSNDEDGDATKASPERPDTPSIEDPIESVPVMVTPLRGERPCRLFMDWFPNLNGNEAEVDNGAYPQPAYPRRQTCLESITSIGWVPSGTYVDGPFDPTTYLFEHGLDQPSSTLCQDDPNEVLESEFTAMAFDNTTAASPQHICFRPRTDSIVPDAMDVSVTSSESYEELDLKSPLKLPAKKTSVSGETPQLQTCKFCIPSGLVSPSEVGGNTLSNVRQTLRKRKSSSKMHSSDHESFASGERDAHMITMEDSKSLVSTKRRVRRSDPDIKEYITPKKEDVLFGRGGKSNNHPGNLDYRKCIVVEQPNYQALPDGEKRIFSQKIVDWVHQDCKGRFVKKDEYGWFLVTLPAALEKVSQALRENHTEEGKRQKKEKSRPKSKQIGGKQKRSTRTK
jgi:hypothetical protein